MSISATLIGLEFGKGIFSPKFTVGNGSWIGTGRGGLT